MCSKYSTHYRFGNSTINDYLVGIIPILQGNHPNYHHSFRIGLRRQGAYDCLSIY